MSWRIKLLRGTAKITGPLIKVFQPFIFTESERSDNHFPVFIVGAPRTGSTILYQMLTQSTDCLYIDNLVYAFSNNLPFGFWLSNILYGNRGHASFESTYGNTESLHAPSECGAFWFQWFSRDQDFAPAGSLSPEAIKQMRTALSTVMDHYEKSVVIKNLNAGQRMQVLAQAFPNSRFIHIKRDPFFSIQSLLKARQDQAMPEDRWWSVKPKNFEELLELDYIDRIVAQVFFLEQQIHHDSASIPAGQFLSVNYSRLHEQFNSVVTFLGLPHREQLEMASFRFDNRLSADAQLQAKIKTAMSKYNWNQLGYER